MKTNTAPPHYVLTGGPCAGKTTTIFEFEKRGYTVAPEPARLVIDERLVAGESIEQIKRDPSFLGSVVRKGVAIAQSVPAEEVCFFDRSVPDSLAYYKAFNVPLDSVINEALAAVQYRKIFLLDLVDFQNDEARDETPQQAMILHGLIREAYVEQGYKVVEVPVMPVSDRADFILANL